MVDLFPQGVAWLDDKFVDISKAKISILDWGFLRSDATYDVVHVWNKRFFLIDSHIDRFFNSTKKLRMPCKLSKKKIKKILATCVKKSSLSNAYVEIIQTRGVSPGFDRDPRKSVPRVMAFAVPFGWILKPKDFEKGLSVAVTKIKRISPDSIDSKIKNYHWLDFVSGMFEAYDKNKNTAILVDQDNNILEGPGFNIFFVKKMTLYTPKKGVLEGITRGAVLKIAKELKIPVYFNSMSKKKLKLCDEVFVTSTAGGIMPITNIDGRLINGGKVGSVTKRIHSSYWKKHKDPDWSCSVLDLL